MMYSRERFKPVVYVIKGDVSYSTVRFGTVYAFSKLMKNYVWNQLYSR